MFDLSLRLRSGLTFASRDSVLVGERAKGGHTHMGGESDSMRERRAGGSSRRRIGACGVE